MTVYEQSKIFCIFFIVGLFIGFIFDIFRGLRKCFKFSNLSVGIQDIIFLFLTRVIDFKKYYCF